MVLDVAVTKSLGPDDLASRSNGKRSPGDAILARCLFDEWADLPNLMARQVACLLGSNTQSRKEKYRTSQQNSPKVSPHSLTLEDSSVLNTHFF